MQSRITKVTLELEGADEELRAILSAVWREWSHLNDAQHRRDLDTFGLQALTARSNCSLHGTLTVKEDLPYDG